MSILEKLANAKLSIAQTKISKEWSNDFSHYEYFTPSQVAWLVQKVCNENKLYTKFDLKRDEYGVYGVLTVYDIEDWSFIQFEWATAIPEIKATNVAQQIWGCMTYTERYLKMTAFGITDNSLDFDTTENTKKVAEKKDITKEWPFTDKNDLPWFNDPDFEKLKSETEWMKEKQTSDELLKSLETKFKISKAMKQKIADLRASL